jgi:cell wall-associated NlpC family hydrolase
VRTVTVTTIAAVALGCAGCGGQQRASSPPSAGGGVRAIQSPTVPHAHPQTVQPTAGGVPSGGGPASVGVGGSGPATGSGAPSAGRTLAQPVSDAQVRAQLAASHISADPGRATLTSNLLAVAPIAAPAQVEAVINAGNQIAHLPYLWGGGHAKYEDSAYDCSGSISFVLAAAGLLNGTMTSGQLMNWGAPGPGKWVTVYASQGHTFMYVAGLRFDTVALAEQGSRWSNRSANDGGAFVARHPVGL